MRFVACLALSLGLAAVPAVVAQEHAAEQTGHEATHETAKEGGEHGSNVELWKWANFALLAGALGYLIGKNAGPFFASRSKQIRSDMAEAEATRKDAEARAAEVDRRLASLETEIGVLRDASQAEAEAERQRLTQHSGAEIAKIQANAEQEIASAGKAARMELKRYTAELAVGLAEQKIRARMNPDSQHALVDRFVENLK
jgi:F-type H+-transporting ATPase subunit b